MSHLDDADSPPMVQRSKVEQESWNLIDLLKKQYDLDSILAEVHRLCGIPGDVIRRSQSGFNRLNVNDWKLIRQSLWQIQDFPELQFKLSKAGDPNQKKIQDLSRPAFVPVHPPVTRRNVQPGVSPAAPKDQIQSAGRASRRHRKSKSETVQPHPEEYERLHAYLRERNLIN